MVAKKSIRWIMCIIVMMFGINAWGQAYQSSTFSPHQAVSYNSAVVKGLRKLFPKIIKKKPNSPKTPTKTVDKVHPKTGIPYNAKGFPIFDAKYRVKIPKNMYLKNDYVQFRECNRQLRNEILNNKSLAKDFTSKQCRQIIEGKTPEGYVWHHSEQEGVLELVDRVTHTHTHHSGGRLLWGGGSSHR